LPESRALSGRGRSAEELDALLNQAVELLTKLRQHVGVAVRADLHVFLLEVDGSRAAPKTEVGIVGFAGTVHAAAHHGDRDAMSRSVDRELFHVLGELDEALVFHARAARARNDVQALAELGNGD